jgi:peptidoglycan/xylan/chitin deacetylase (PgdA/CDA1 family)
MYHRVDNGSPGDPPALLANTTLPSTFDRQMDYLADHDYNVIGYGDLVACLEGKVSLPPKAVVITFDDGWRGRYTHAFPSLVRHGFTATFFVITDVMTSGYQISWDEAGEMVASGMTIGSHTKSHRGLRHLSDAELADELAGSRAVMEEQLGVPVLYLAYPYGMFNERVVAAAKAAGYISGRAAWDGDGHAQDDLFSVYVKSAASELGVF